MQRQCRVEKLRFYLQLICTLFLLSSMPLAAEEDRFFERYILWLGGHAGYHLIDTDPQVELEKDGFQLDAEASISYSWRLITADVGGGWFYGESEASSTTPPIVRDGVTTQAGFARFGARYRFTSRIEAGIVNRLLIGDDTRFSVTGPDQEPVNWFAGLEAVYRIPWKYPLQFAVAWLTDLTVTDRQIYQFMGGVKIGIPLPKRDKRPKLVAAKPEPEKKKYSYEIKNIEFDFDSDRVRPEAMLKEIGDFLEKHNSSWDGLLVEGHTDSRGSYEYNLDLSQRRANAVMKVLLGQGVEESKIEAKGYSFSRPIEQGENEQAWQRNRRVELSFDSVDDPESFAKFFNQLNEKYSR